MIIIQKQICFKAICVRPHDAITMIDKFSEQDSYCPKTVYGYYAHLFAYDSSKRRKKSQNLRYFGILSSLEC